MSSQSASSASSSTFVAFNFPLSVKTESDALPLLASLPVDIVIDSLHHDPTFALLTTSRPEELVQHTGALENGVIVYQLATLLSDENMIQPSPKKAASAAGGSPSKALAAAAAGGESVSAASVIEDKSLIVRLRQAILAMLARTVVRTEVLVDSVSRQVSGLADKYHVSSFIGATKSTTVRVIGDADAAFGLTEKINFAKNKASKVREEVGNRLAPIRTYVGKGACVARATTTKAVEMAGKVFTTASNTVSKATEVAESLPVVGAGVKLAEKTASWGFGRASAALSSAKGIAGSIFSYIGSVKEATVSEFESSLEEARLQEEAKRVRAVVRATNQS